MRHGIERHADVILRRSDRTDGATPHAAGSARPTNGFVTNRPTGVEGERLRSSARTVSTTMASSIPGAVMTSNPMPGKPRSAAPVGLSRGPAPHLHLASMTSKAPGGGSTTVPGESALRRRRQERVIGSRARPALGRNRAGDGEGSGPLPAIHIFMTLHGQHAVRSAEQPTSLFLRVSVTVR